MNNSTKIGVSTSHSKVILSGEHAVVYDKPAIAIPFPLKITSIIEKSKGPLIFESDIYTGYLSNMPVKLKGLSNLIMEVLNDLNKPIENLKIKILSSIPIGRGLGSSAAISISIVRSLFSFFEKEVSEEKLFGLVQASENYTHGKSSGLDIYATMSNCPIWFEKEKGISKIEIKDSLYIVVADTGCTSDTKIAVGNVRKLYKENTEIIKKSLEKIGQITIDIKDALLNGDLKLLGRLLTDNHNELIKIGVSDEKLNDLVKLALKSNALGAKLTGGGLGGCMIAITCDNLQAKKIAGELVKSGAKNAWYFMVNSDTIMEVN